MAINETLAFRKVVEVHLRALDRFLAASNAEDFRPVAFTEGYRWMTIPRRKSWQSLEGKDTRPVFALAWGHCHVQTIQFGNQEACFRPRRGRHLGA